jgi:hypothetical protein
MGPSQAKLFVTAGLHNFLWIVSYGLSYGIIFCGRSKSSVGRNMQVGIPRGSLFLGEGKICRSSPDDHIRLQVSKWWQKYMKENEEAIWKYRALKMGHGVTDLNLLLGGKTFKNFVKTNRFLWRVVEKYNKFSDDWECTNMSGICMISFFF